MLALWRSGLSTRVPEW